ncbi:MAG TPA: hypothetical protein PK152_07530 [Anaerolineales bacterium]|nr:hypothetical protein [Anaerolineales bacterium]HRK88969.1 hypothetical protein [Anaerolineales bacterium]
MSVKLDQIGTGFLLLIIILGCGFPFINDNSQDSRRSVVITIDLNQRQEFFDQLSKFAEANGFTILIETLSSSNEEFQIDMTREDIIIAGATGELDKYYIGFYDVLNQPPAPDLVFDDLVNQLERYVTEVPGTTFLIRK